MTGPIDMWRPVADKWTEVFTLVGDADWDKPTPCADWNVRGLVDHNLLMIFINGCKPHPAGNHDVSLPARLSHFVNALPRRESLHLNLAGKHRGFIVIQQSEKRYLTQDGGIASHVMSSGRENSTRGFHKFGGETTVGYKTVRR